MSSPLLMLTLAAALGSAVVAGVFFAFSTFVMAGLGRLAPARGVEAMQSINVTAINPWFMSALFGTAALSLALLVAGLEDLGSARGRCLFAAALLYLVGAIAVTMAANQPQNRKLGGFEPGSAAAAGYWPDYLARWLVWNHIRTLLALIAAGLEIAAIHVG